MGLSRAVDSALPLLQGLLGEALGWIACLRGTGLDCLPQHQALDGALDAKGVSYAAVLAARGLRLANVETDIAHNWEERRLQLISRRKALDEYQLELDSYQQELNEERRELQQWWDALPVAYQLQAPSRPLTPQPISEPALKLKPKPAAEPSQAQLR